MKGVKVDFETLKRIKTEAPGIYSKQILGKQQLAKMFGIDRVTLWRIEQSNPSFKRAMTEAYEAQNLLRDEGVEDAYTNKLLKGEGSAADYIFYLCNRLPHRWKNGHYIEHSVHLSDGEAAILAEYADDDESILTKDHQGHSTTPPKNHPQIEHVEFNDPVPSEIKTAAQAELITDSDQDSVL